MDVYFNQRVGIVGEE